MRRRITCRAPRSRLKTADEQAAGRLELRHRVALPPGEGLDLHVVAPARIVQVTEPERAPGPRSRVGATFSEVATAGQAP
ncbi:MAG: hypothetical protein R3D25_02795 [Geminicoccaceae bacterium]